MDWDRLIKDIRLEVEESIAEALEDELGMYYDQITELFNEEECKFGKQKKRLTQKHDKAMVGKQENDFPFSEEWDAFYTKLWDFRLKKLDKMNKKLIKNVLDSL